MARQDRRERRWRWRELEKDPTSMDVLVADVRRGVIVYVLVVDDAVVDVDVVVGCCCC